MDIPDSVIDPAAATPDTFRYVVALKDDDWDHWTGPEQWATYLGVRDPASGHWQVRSLDGTPIDWTYADDEIIVLGQA